MAGSRTRRSSGDEGGTAEGDERSGIRKWPEGGSKQGPGGPWDQGAEKVAAAWVTCLGSHVGRAARASPGSKYCAPAQYREPG